MQNNIIFLIKVISLIIVTTNGRYSNISIIRKVGNGFSFQILCGRYAFTNGLKTSYAYRYVPQICVPFSGTND